MLALVLAATFFVSNSADSGPGSLRQAILDANKHPGADTIQLKPALMIDVQTALPVVTGTIEMDGGEMIWFDGFSSEGKFPGLVLGPGADKSMIEGIVITGFSAGITLNGVRDCIIGPGMVISGNGTGVVVKGRARNNQIFGNAIGVDADLASPDPNRIGIEVLPNAVDTDITNNRIFDSSVAGVVVRGARTTGTSLDVNDLIHNDVAIALEDGANRQQAAPVITSATANGSEIVVRGSLTSAKSTRYRVQFFADGWYIGYTNVTTNASGTATFDVTLPKKIVSADITAAATNELTNDTSMWSAATPVAAVH